MKTHDEAAKLRRMLEERGATRGKRFEPGLRQRVVRFAEQRRREGASWMTVAQELGACFETIRRWCAMDASAVRMRPVEVVADLVAPSAEATVLTVITPNGLRIEGAGVADVVALVRALG